MNPTVVNSLLRSLAAHGLSSEVSDFPGAPLNDETWQAVAEGVRLQRIAPLLAQAIADGALPATPAQTAAAMDLECEALNHSLSLEASLVEIGELLDDAEVRFRVLKGSAVAHLDYPNPAMREFGDVDLLIHPDDIDHAVTVLVGHGFTRRYPEPRPGFDRRFTKSVSMEGPKGREVDLHRTLAIGGFGQRIIVDMLWTAPADEFSVGGRNLRALGAEERLLHACYHMVLGGSPPRLVPQRDIVQMLLTGRVAADSVAILAAAWRSEAVIARALTTACKNLRVPADLPLVRWASTITPRRGEARELARATSSTYSYAAQAMDSFRAIRGPRRRIAFVSALAFPRRSYLGDRHPGFTSRVRYAVTEVVTARTMTKENR